MTREEIEKELAFLREFIRQAKEAKSSDDLEFALGSFDESVLIKNQNNLFATLVDLRNPGGGSFMKFVKETVTPAVHQSIREMDVFRAPAPAVERSVVIEEKKEAPRTTEASSDAIALLKGNLQAIIDTEGSYWLTQVIWSESPSVQSARKALAKLNNPTNPTLTPDEITILKGKTSITGELENLLIGVRSSGPSLSS